ncbi:brevican core protein isoform X7 [Manis pentadactyla]|uniref:brevican core protein isoform X7 n=1 Tax=Manis pentadactyla TaxID=143292 RepID=UPI00255C4538|nr:brevican core protein isoform X7 [Manis pentadactyla]
MSERWSYVPMEQPAVPPSACSMAPLFLPLLATLALAQVPAALADALERDSSEDRAFRVRIVGTAPLQGVLGGTLTIPCHVHYLRPPPGRRAVLGSPRVKWTFLSGGREAEVLVARGLRVKVSEAYRFRVALPAYPASLTNVSLALSELRPNDSGIYRCEVQQGIDDSSDAVEVKVKGVVFLYREGSARYAFSFSGAQEACARIGARIATPEQLYAAYLGGYEQCDAGWLSDQTVRYPIQTPREACYGDMDGFPGVRNYGVVDPDDLYDVYCYAEDLNDSAQPSAIPEVSNPASDLASDGLEAIVTVTETLEELQLPQGAVESESRGAIYSIPIVEDGGGGSSTPEDPAEAPRTLLEFKTQTIVPPLGSSEEEDKVLEEDEKYKEEEKEEEEEEEEVEDEALWAWPSELSSLDEEAYLPTEPALEESLSEASPPLTRAVLQPDVSPPPDGEPEAPRPPGVLGPPTGTLPTPREGSLAPPPPFTPAGAREVGEETGGPELSGVPRGESEETGSSEESPLLLPATRAPEGPGDPEVPSEENSGRTVPAGTSVRAQPVLPTDSAGQGGVAMAPSPGDCVPSPCHNGGTCLEEEEGVRCLCLPGYGGDLCNIGLHFCSPGWDSFQGSCYKHFSTRRSWQEAETQCRMYGAHLASISTPEEQDFINNRYREYQWIGLNDRTIEGDFLWSDGVPLLYENWNPGQPDSYFLSGENCVVMVWHDQGQWSDVPCNYHLSYTCKMGLVSCGPPPELPLAQVSGRPQLRYEVHTVLRYRCREGLAQRNLPLIRCQEDGRWEPPQISCVPRRPARALHPTKVPEGHQWRLLGRWKVRLTPPSSPVPGP